MIKNNFVKICRKDNRLFSTLIRKDNSCCLPHKGIKILFSTQQAKTTPNVYFSGKQGIIVLHKRKLVNFYSDTGNGKDFQRVVYPKL